ncbi:MAG TPA: hypothetical protein VF503_20070 [Sphingobium sp.]|uniref:hypothetical protein n=1 Tax=Sphingobium sp. TaxID=1912891 RepID=UPI002ED15142
MAGTILSILMLAGVALLAGGLYLIIRMGERKRGGLMLLAAVVMFANVAIWVMPTQSGKSLSAPDERPR